MNREFLLIMPKQINKTAQLLLSNKEWLFDQHVLQKMSITELSKQLSVTPAVIRRYIKQYNITSPSQQELREASNIRKYGVSNTGMLPEIRSKAIDTMKKKYGGHNWSNASGKRHIRDNTCEKKYGNKNVAKTKYAKTKTKKSNLQKYNREHINQSHIPLDVITKLNDSSWLYDQHVTQQKTLSLIAQELGFNNDMTTAMRYLHKHNIPTQHFQHSTGEKEVLNFIQDLLPNTVIISNTFSVIPPKELDIYIPSHNIAIEYCGLYWHSEQNGKDKWYHYNKWKGCNDKGIQLITIFEDEWYYKKEQVKNKIKSLLGMDDRKTVFARKCSIVEIDTQTKQQFFNDNHIQGDGPGSINIGLQYDNDIIACMSFIKKKNDVYYLNRYATSVKVPGGFSKLLKYFKLTNNWNNIISFADRRWSNGNLYKTTGWIKDVPLRPDYYYIEGNKRVHKFNYRRKFLSQKLLNFDPKLSERKNCDNNGILRIWDCGKIKFKMENTNEG